MISTLYTDDDGYICLDHTIDRNVAFTWTLHADGWEVYLGEVCIYSFDDFGYTYPTQAMFSLIERMISHFRYVIPSGMWEVSYVSDKTNCREHFMFDEFEDALTHYQNLVKEGEIEE